MKHYSLKTTLYKSWKAFALCAGFFSLFAISCKERSVIKPDLIPGVDGVNTFEVKDFDMTVQNAYFDSLYVNDYTYPIVALGRINNDVFFGKTAAGAYMQFVPPAANFVFPADMIKDSVILVMPYLGLAYGDTDRTNLSNALMLKVHEVTATDFAFGDGKTKWYSSQQFAYNTNVLLGSGTVTLKSLSDTFTLANNDTISGVLRLKMASALFDRIAGLSAEQMASGTAFQEAFRGVFVGADTTQAKNTLAYFAVSGGSSSSAVYQKAHLQFYYHTATDATLRRAVFQYGTASAFSNSVLRNYTGFPAAGFYNSTANRDSLVIQGYPGFRSDVTVKLNDKVPPSIVNKAALELVVLNTGDEGRFNPPTQLIVTKINDDGTTTSLADVLDATGAPNSAALAFVDGKPRRDTINGVAYYRYTINMPREVQRTLAEGKTEMKLRIACNQVYPGAFRMVAAGPNASDDLKMRFSVIYTKQN